MDKTYFVYFMTNKNNNVLYTGFTGDLGQRIYQHKNGLIGGFTKKYNCHKLIYFEAYHDAEAAILREKQIKRWIRKKKNELINKINPQWKDLSEEIYGDPSTAPGFHPGFAQDDNSFNCHPERSAQRAVEGYQNRYEKQLLLPEFTPAHQEFLKNTKLLMIGAGGLGAPALPYLAGAGIGHITIIDHDKVDITNLHRQTIYKDSDAGKNKAGLAASYLQNLNPGIKVIAVPQKATSELCVGFDLILDGSDNFETKSLLNDISIKTKTPLISAGVEGFNGMAGIFAGHADVPCYRCLYPELPLDACNCNEAGILGTVAGLAGLYQAHLTLCFLLGIGDTGPGTILSFDFKHFRMQYLKLSKNKNCKYCTHSPPALCASPPLAGGIRGEHIPLLHPTDLTNHLIVDVRTHGEVAKDPIEKALHMPLDVITARYNELPRDKPLAFACASNARSMRAAEFMAAKGYTNLYVLDRSQVDETARAS